MACSRSSWTPAADADRSSYGRPIAVVASDPLQGGRIVGHDAVDPEIDESLHLERIVDGPDVNRTSGSTSASDGRLRHHRDRTLRDGNLEAIRCRRNEPGQPARDFDRTGAGAHAGPPANRRQSTMAERSDAHAIETRVTMEECE